MFSPAVFLVSAAAFLAALALLLTVFCVGVVLDNRRVVRGRRALARASELGR